MGREWYFKWGSKSSAKKGGIKDGSGDGGGGRGASEKKMVRPQVVTAAAAAAASGGCMNAMLHMFDLNHFHLCLHPQNSTYLPDDPTPLKGVEAPRNSLECITKGEHDYSLNIPMDIQIKTNRRDTSLKLVHTSGGKVQDTISESSCSPAVEARTPTLIARLMGLDILPESTYNTPRSSSSYSRLSTPPSTTTKPRKKSSYSNDVPSPGSLAESPRSSSSQRRRSTAVVDPHRLSLQINKENSIVKEMESSRPSCSAINTKRKEGRKYEEENKSPGYYAKQIMKQVKETVSSRRVGSDITNTIGQKELRRDENLLSAKPPTKSKKSRLLKSTETSKSVSKKLCDSEVLRYDVQEIVPTMDKLQLKPVQSENKKQLKHEEQYFTDKFDVQLKKIDVIGNKPCSKTPPKFYESIRNKKDIEQFVRPPTRVNNSATEKKSKKTPLSSDLVHGSVPSVVPLKKASCSPQATPKLLEEQGSSKAQITNLINNLSNTPTRSSCSPNQQTSEKVQEEATHKPVNREKKKDRTTPTTYLAEFQYISRILKCSGIDKETPTSFTKWFSPSHPLDPTIYHNLEAAHYHNQTNTDHYSPFDFNLRLSINRKLIFHLVDEILADILKPISKVKKSHQQKEQINGLQLLKTLCSRIRSFPNKDCQTLQDIDALVENDMPTFGTVSNSHLFEEEGEAIVSEIEQAIIDSLVHELFCGRS